MDDQMELGFDLGDLVDFVCDEIGSASHMNILDPNMQIWEARRIDDGKIVARQSDYGIVMEIEPKSD